LITFVQKEKEKLWQRLQLWQRNIEAKVDKEKYLQICAELDEKPDPAKMPPDLSDFPADVQKAIVVYGKLGDRMAAEVGYLGKDFTTINLYIDIYGVECKDLFLETLLLLDQNMIEKSAQAMKRERDKLKKK
jgi:hypothetical protein